MWEKDLIHRQDTQNISRKKEFRLLIQRCKTCSKQFKWKSIIRSIWLGYKPIECDNCKSKYHIRFISKLLISLSIALPILFQNYLSSLFKSYSILIYLLWVLLVILISPFLSRYNKESSQNL